MAEVWLRSRRRLGTFSGMSGSLRPQFVYGQDAVALRPESRPKDVAAAIKACIRRLGSVVVTLRAEDPLPTPLIQAAAAELSGVDNAELYVLGYRDSVPSEVLLRFQRVRHLNLNARSIDSWDFLSKFAALRTLIIQDSGGRKLGLDFLDGMEELKTLTIPAGVARTDALGRNTTLKYLHCSSSQPVLEALACHRSLEYLDVSFGSNRDLRSIPQIRSLIGLAIYQIKGLTGEDLDPLSDCHDLRALSLGALRNVTHLAALAGNPRLTLRALLLEGLPNLGSLSDVGGCHTLEKLGLYGSRPKDKDLQPLSRLQHLGHLVLGDPYPASEITALIAWYDGDLQYRQISRGAGEPRWRTPIDRLL